MGKSTVRLDKILLELIDRLKGLASPENCDPRNRVINMLSHCLALTETYGTDRAEFKLSVPGTDGEIQYSKSGDDGFDPYRPVLWQVFDGPPEDVLNAFRGVLALVKLIAEHDDIALTDTSAVVEMMKGFPLGALRYRLVYPQ